MGLNKIQADGTGKQRCDTLAPENNNHSNLQVLQFELKFLSGRFFRGEFHCSKPHLDIDNNFFNRV